MGDAVLSARSHHVEARLRRRLLDHDIFATDSRGVHANANTRAGKSLAGPRSLCGNSGVCSRAGSTEQQNDEDRTATDRTSRPRTNWSKHTAAAKAKKVGIIDQHHQMDPHKEALVRSSSPGLHRTNEPQPQQNPN